MMDWLIFTALTIAGFKAAVAFNIDPVAWKTLRNAAEGFGYQIVQRQSELLVSAPLAQYSQNRRGAILKCSTETCRSLPVSATFIQASNFSCYYNSEMVDCELILGSTGPDPTVPDFAINMSLGLSMAIDPSTNDAVVCGPTVPKDCRSITMYNGVCMKIYSSNRIGSPMPSSLDECRSEADIAFLLDGSGSVGRGDFDKMKTFVINLIDFFVDKDFKFAVVQFSSNPRIHYTFNNFNVNTWKRDINGITQLRGGTNTARAIRTVVDNVFSEDAGSRPNVKKILIVITDGESTDSQDLESAVDLAKGKNIVRFAIGVGSAFQSETAKNELNGIASSPSAQHVFQVQNFNALDAIQRTLQDSIFAIEGSQSSGERLKMEMAQRGFSAAFAPGGVQITSIGANEWRGGFQTYVGRGGSSYLPMDIDPDSYLGYSIAVARGRFSSVTVLGAPRYRHRGIVMVISQNSLAQKIDPLDWQYQIGEYFGAVVCAMDVSRDKTTDLILISAPMFTEGDREGRVYVCVFINLRVDCRFDSPTVLRGAQSPRGRFGSSLAVLPDLNSDRLNDLAVGAPLEDDGQGSVYIFHGERTGISTTFSQRIAGSEFPSRLRFFGTSISQSSADLSGDGLPDLAVGSKGAVTLLRSKPIVTLEHMLTYTPKQVPTIANCDDPKLFRAQICLMMRNLSNVKAAKARVNYTLTLDATRKVPSNRAYVSDKNREKGGTVILDLARPQCFSVNFYVEPCPEDALNPLYNELRFSFEGLPGANKLSPSLTQQAQTSAVHPLGFEIDCGKDNQCVDDIKLDFNFSRSLELKVGIDELLNVTVFVENTGENSYNTIVFLTYPAAFSYRKFTVLQGRVECNSLDSEGGVSRGKTDCTIDKPIFRQNATAIFVVSYGIDTKSQLDSRIFVTANATSGNERHSASSQLHKVKDIGVKYSIFLTMESSLHYINFTYGKNDVQKSLRQSVLVSNNIRALNVTVVIRVPVKLGEKDIWANLSTLEIPDCQWSGHEKAKAVDFVGQLQKNKRVDCSVATCRVFKCNRFMGRLEDKRYTISANMSAAWIQQIGLDKAKFILTSTASLEYDKNQYIFFSTSSANKPPVRKIETEVEVYPQPDFTKEIVGGSLGGLAILVILSAVLYKVGFFKSKYKDMMNDTDDAAHDEATLTQE